MRNSGILIVLLVLLSFSAVAESAPIIHDVVLEKPLENDCLYYFFGADCDNCPQVEEFMVKMVRKYPQVRVQRFEVYRNQENRATLQEFYAAYNVPKASQGVPVIFMPGSYFSGTSIITLLENRLLDNHDNSCPNVQNQGVVGIVGHTSPENVLDTLGFVTVSRAALGDSFNLGAIALILILLAGLFSVKDNDEMFKKGCTFVLGVYIGFFLYGVGLFDWFGASRIGEFFYKTVGILSVIFGLLNMKGFFKTWDVWAKSVSDGFKQSLKQFLDFLLSFPGFLIVGFVGSMFTFSEVSGTFLSIRALFVEASTRFVIWPLLLYYDFLFVFHLVAVVLFLYLARAKMKEIAHHRGKSSDKKLELWKKHNQRVVNFFVSVIMTVLGLIVVFL